MAFSLPEVELIQTEMQLGATFPSEYRRAMMATNGGGLVSSSDSWELYPIRDGSDRKRLARTCNHVLKETEACREFGNFPEHAIAIAGNGGGDQLVLIRDEGSFDSAVYQWLHETGKVQKLAASFTEIQKL